MYLRKSFASTVHCRKHYFPISLPTEACHSDSSTMSYRSFSLRFAAGGSSCQWLRLRLPPRALAARFSEWGWVFDDDLSRIPRRDWSVSDAPELVLARSSSTMVDCGETPICFNGSWRALSFCLVPKHPFCGPGSGDSGHYYVYLTIYA